MLKILWAMEKEITIASALLFEAAAICFYPTNKLSKNMDIEKLCYVVWQCL